MSYYLTFPKIILREIYLSEDVNQQSGSSHLFFNTAGKFESELAMP